MEDKEILEMDSLGPRSKVVSAFFDKLNQMGEIYAVMNNYEDLPRIIPSDVDITISQNLFRKLDKLILVFAEEQSSRIVQKLWHGNYKCAYILAVEDHNQFEFVQLDFFVDFSTKGCPRLISHQDLVAGRTSFRNFYIPRPETELLFTLMRRLFKDDWSIRHSRRVMDLMGRICESDKLPSHYGWLTPTLEAALEGDLVTLQQRRVSDWPKLKKTAYDRLSFFEKIENFIMQTWRIAFRLKDETGYLAVIIGTDLDLDCEIFASLKDVFHRRLIIDVSTLGEIGVIGEFMLLSRIVLLKRRKALIVVNIGSQPTHLIRLIVRFAKFGLVDHIFNFGSAALILPRSFQSTPIDSMSNLVPRIAISQSQKTLAAIARGGTQTSG